MTSRHVKRAALLGTSVVLCLAWSATLRRPLHAHEWFHNVNDDFEYASPNFLETYPTTAGSKLATDCALCHTGSGFSLNGYGAAFLANGKLFPALEALDSDGDGFTNLQEILALTFPGDPNDRPVTAPVQSSVRAHSDGPDPVPGNEAATIVTVVNGAPAAAPQTVSLSEDAATAITLAGSDFEGAALGFTIVDSPAHGTLSGTAPSLDYAPDANYHGADSFTFKVSDGTFDSAPATVSLSIASVNDAPVALADSATTPAGTAVVIPVLTNDSDVENDSLSIASVTQGTGGSVVANPDGTLTYTADLAFSGLDSFEYVTDDGNGGSANANVTVSVTPTLAGLQAQVRVLAIGPGAPVALTATLRAAERARANGNERAAAAALRGFVALVDALRRTGRLDAATAARLIAEAGQLGS